MRIGPMQLSIVANYIIRDIYCERKIIENV